MNIILKNTLDGLIRGIIASAVLYFGCFVVEFFTFIGQYRDQKTAGHGDLTLDEYEPVIAIVWKWQAALLIVGAICILAVIIGFFIGYYYYRSDKVDTLDGFEIDSAEGSIRQKQRYAQSVKTMAESLTQKCDENLCYMKNIVETDYICEKALNDVMTEMIKFVEYERIIKEAADEASKGGRR